MTHDDALRRHLVALLNWRSAHATFDDALAGLPPGDRGRRTQGLPHSPWQLLEHLRISQRDILDFCRDPAYAEPSWPDDYWPDDAAPPGDGAWHTAVEQVHEDLRAMQTLVADPGTDLFAPIPHGNGQTILREALLLADHNAYHVGQLVLLRRLLGCWPPSDEVQG